MYTFTVKSLRGKDRKIPPKKDTDLKASKKKPSTDRMIDRNKKVGAGRPTVAGAAGNGTPKWKKAELNKLIDSPKVRKQLLSEYKLPEL